jgi:endoglucanase
MVKMCMEGRYMKKFLSLVLTGALMLGTLSLSACGTTAGDTQTGGNAQEADTTATALEFVKKMGNGINLGNTMEAYGRSVYGTTAEISDYETCWGQPETTQEMIQGMKNAGFDTIRIPVAWTNKMNFDEGDYTIDDSLLDRIDEIIGWAVDAGMYVIVNDHWDGGWWGMFGSATQETRDEAMEMYTQMWTQIAERYKDYDEHLILESGNEELGSRLNDTDQCADSGSLSEDECYETANAINQKFVDVVRSSGGNNASRFLLIAGYNTDIRKTCDERFVMPTDTIADHLLVSVHYYDPWNYCGDDGEQGMWGTKSEYEYMNYMISMLTQFTEQGVGVVIGEFGALPTKDGEYRNNMIAYFTNLLDNCDKYNICPVLWDRGDFYSKTEYKVIDMELNRLYGSRCYAVESQKDEEQLLAETEERMETALAEAPESFEEEEEINLDELDSPVAWIMWNGGGASYSVGDTYNPQGDCTAGLVAVDAAIDGAGTYTVSLDFTGTDVAPVNGLTFAALAVSNGELFYPGCILDIQEIDINGTPIDLTAVPYTTSDDKKCTRVNLYNEWVALLPDDAHNLSGDLSEASPMIVDKADFTAVETISITFDFITAE